MRQKNHTLGCQDEFFLPVVCVVVPNYYLSECNSVSWVMKFLSPGLRIILISLTFQGVLVHRNCLENLISQFLNKGEAFFFHIDSTYVHILKSSSKVHVSETKDCMH